MGCRQGLVDQHGGEVPESLEALVKLPWPISIGIAAGTRVAKDIHVTSRMSALTAAG